MAILKVVIFCCIILSMDVIIGAPTNSRRSRASEDNSADSDEDQQKFYEVDAFGDDYTDFGAVTGPKGAFSWHATYPLE